MLIDKSSQHVPAATFKTRKNGAWADVTTAQLFDGKTVAVFALPGAYTPTCSSTHLPRFNELANTFKAHGVDDVVCISVNDCFVMDEWGASQEAENITLIPDGNGEFTQGMGMLVDKSDLGFGKRSWRYSMLVKNGVIDKMFIEPEVEGDPFEVSDADTLLAYVAPGVNAPLPITIFTKPNCSYCVAAKDMLHKAGLRFEEIGLSHHVTSRSLQAVAGAGTTPQIFVGGVKIGGSEELAKWLAKRAE